MKSSHSLAVDPSGSIWLATDAAVDNANSFDTSDILLVQFSSSGNLVQALQWGSELDDHVSTLKIDRQGALYLSGSTKGFNATLSDVFVAKLSANGNLTYALSWGGSHDDYGKALIVDAEDSAWITGKADSFATNGDKVFLLQVSSEGGPTFAKYWDGQYSSGNALALNSQGELWLSGSEFVIQSAERVAHPWFSSSYADYSSFTDIEKFAYRVNASAYPSKVVTNETEMAVGILPKITMDILTVMDSVSLKHLFNTRPYPLGFIAPLHQTLFIGDSLLLELLHLDAKINTTPGLTIPATPDWLSLSTGQNRLMGTATIAMRGEYPVELIVDDNKNRTWRYKMLVDVPNAAPSYQGNTTLVMEIDGLISLETIASGFSDPDGDAYQFALAANPKPPLWFVLNPQTGIVSATMLSGYQGNYTVNITATDECGGNSACGQVGWQLFEVVVPNRAPYYQFDLEDPDIMQLGSSLKYVVSSDTVIDLDGDRISWVAKLANGSVLPEGINFSPVTRRLRGTPSAGVYLVEFIAMDSYGGGIKQTIELRVNTSPSAISVPLQLAALPVGQRFMTELPIDFMKDADGDLLAYSLVESNAKYFPPSWLSLTNRTLTGVPIANDHQAITIQLVRHPFCKFH